MEKHSTFYSAWASQLSPSLFRVKSWLTVFLFLKTMAGLTTAPLDVVVVGVDSSSSAPNDGVDFSLNVVMRSEMRDEES